MDEQPTEPACRRAGRARLTAWTERWIPDAFIFALLATVIVFVAALDLDAVDVPDRWSTPGAAASGT